MKNTILILLFFLATQYASAQKTNLIATAAEKENFSELDQYFQHFDLHQVDVTALLNKLEKSEESLQLAFQFENKKEVNLVLGKNQYLKYKADHSQTIYTLMGSSEEFSAEGAALTFAPDMIFGLFHRDGQPWFIEPLWYIIPEAPKNIMLSYAADAAIRSEARHCGFHEVQQKRQQFKADQDHDQIAKNSLALVVELAMASDFSMLNRYLSEPAVVAHNLAVMNTVAADFDDAFSAEIIFEVVDQYVSDFPNNDPVSNSGNGEVLLNEFAQWATSNLLPHDMGQLWTARDIFVPGIGNSVIGIANLGALCNTYHIIEDFSVDPCLMRVLTSHEIAHNFGAQHNSGDNIMNEFVLCTDQWHPNNIAEINQTLAAQDCMEECNACPFEIDIIQNNCSYTFTANGSSVGSSTWVLTDFYNDVIDTSNITHFAFTPTCNGPYEVCVTVEDCTLCHSFNVDCTDCDLPNVCDFVVEEIDGCTVTLCATDDRAGNHTWHFGNGVLRTTGNQCITETLGVGTWEVEHGFRGLTCSETITVFCQPPQCPQVGITDLGECWTFCFSDQSTEDVVSHHWDFGDGTTSMDSDPCHTYPDEGIYIVTSQMELADGSTLVCSQELVIDCSPPNCPLLDIQSNGCMASATYLGEETNCTVDFGNGPIPIAPQEILIHDFDTPGTYPITLACGDEICEDKVSVNCNNEACGFVITSIVGCAVTINYTGITQRLFRFPVNQYVVLMPGDYYTYIFPGSGNYDIEALGEPYCVESVTLNCGDCVVPDPVMNDVICMNEYPQLGFTEYYTEFRFPANGITEPCGPAFLVEDQGFGYEYAGDFDLLTVQLLDGEYIFEGTYYAPNENEGHSNCWQVNFCAVGSEDLCEEVIICPDDYYPDGCPCLGGTYCGDDSYLELEVACSHGEHGNFNYLTEVAFSFPMTGVKDGCPFNVVLNALNGASPQVSAQGYAFGGYGYIQASLPYYDEGYLDILCIQAQVYPDPSCDGAFPCSYSTCIDISEYFCGEGERNENPLVIPMSHKAVLAYPNPADKSLTITNSQTEPLSMSLFSLTGKQLKSFELESQESRQISVADLPEGVYFLRANQQTQNASSIQKLIIAH